MLIHTNTHGTNRMVISAQTTLAIPAIVLRTTIPAGTAGTGDA
jgi:hypothetical protein